MLLVIFHDVLLINIFRDKGERSEHQVVTQGKGFVYLPTLLLRMIVVCVCVYIS